MNFVYVHTHDSGRIIQPYGALAENPALTALAKEGVLFRQAYCASPTCSPSRAAMLTGMSAHESGMLGLAHRGFCLKDSSRHLSAYLSTQGYHTALFGVQHESNGSRIPELGYAEAYSAKGKSNFEKDTNNLERVRDFLSHAGSAGKPFFLSYGLLNTHRPWSTGGEISPDFIKPPYTVADTPENRNDYRNYLQSIKEADFCVGELIASLRKNGLWEDTAILFTTDHGLAYPNMKCNLFDTGIGVAMILRCPGKEHSACDALVSQIDVFPTVCDILGIKKPDWIEGKSLMPLIDKKTDYIHDFIFSEINFHAVCQPARCVRSKNYKLIRYFDNGEMIKLANIDDSPAKKLYATKPLSGLAHDKVLFFDLDADPTESINLAENEMYRDEYSRHLKALEDWMERTSDPLLKGSDIYALGSGTLTNKADAYSPGEERYIIH